MSGGDDEPTHADTPHASSIDDSDAPRRGDPWAHRRVEPRLLALAWTCYLFAATALTLLSVGGASRLSPDVYRPAARALLVLIGAGIILVWPAIRLSQTPAVGRGRWRAIRATLQDFMVIVMPAQLVIWPQILPWFAKWPIGVVGAVACSTAAWAIAVGGVLAIAEARRVGPRGVQLVLPSGWAWMGVLVVMAAAGPVVRLWGWTTGTRGEVDADVTMMLSPITAMLELTRDRGWTGAPAVVEAAHWWAIGATGAVGLLGWVAAWRCGTGRGRMGRLHSTGG